MDQLYPEKSFDEQLKHVWLTEGRLCSINVEIGPMQKNVCAPTYLSKQIKLLPSATIVGFGSKAKPYLSRLGENFIKAYALAPPGANHKPARPSWLSAIEQIKHKR